MTPNTDEPTTPHSTTSAHDPTGAHDPTTLGGSTLGETRVHGSESVDERNPDLSVVVITENEEDRIGPCLDSVFTACEATVGTVPAVNSFEVVLVDSASTDRTVELAREYPITILRIPDEHTVSCGAGRYVGDSVARGELVLHVDGDMRLTDEWLPRAVSYLREHDVAAVEGNLNGSTQEGVMDVEKVGGVMLYDAATLQEIGGFDPYLQGYEDVDVGYRLTTAGHRLVRLPEVSAEHPESEARFEPFRRWRHGYYLAPGQAIRKATDSPRVMLKLIARQRFKIALLGWLAVGAVSLVTGTGVLLWLLGSLLAFGAIVRRRGLHDGVSFVMAKSFGLAGIAKGLQQSLPSPESYPLEAVEVIKGGSVQHGESGETSEADESGETDETRAEAP
jgi:glycosyltransferase involved in cell wall biosynthesis